MEYGQLNRAIEDYYLSGSQRTFDALMALGETEEEKDKLLIISVKCDKWRNNGRKIDALRAKNRKLRAEIAEIIDRL